MSELKLRMFNSLLKHNTITKRLILTFIIIIIPIYIIGYGIYNNGIGIIKEEILISMQNRSEFIVNSIESDIIQVRSLINDFTLDEDLFSLAFRNSMMSDYQKIEIIIKIQRSLSMIKNSSKYIGEIGINIPSLKRTISTVGNIDIMNEEIFHKLAETSASSQLITLNGKIYIVSKYPYMYTQNKQEPMFLIFAEISTQKLNEYIIEQINNNISIYALRIKSIGVDVTNGKDNSILLSILKNYQSKDLGSKGETGTVTVNGQRYLLNIISSSLINLQLTTIIPEGLVLLRLNNYIVWFWIFTVLIIFVIGLYSLSTRQFIHTPMKRIVNAFTKLEEGDTTVSISHSSGDEFGYLYKQFNKTVSKLNELIENDYKQKILTKNAELRHLQSQINPHFLYNIFFLINSMIQERDYDSLKAFTNQLGTYFKYITRDFENDVPLSKEVEHARIYVNIQQQRYMQRIWVEFDDLPGKYSSILVPRLILQPALENAYEHGLKNKSKDGWIKVWFEQYEKGLNIFIEDNGDELDDNKLEEMKRKMLTLDSDSTGIINVDRRLSIKFGAESGIYLSRGSSGGLRIKISISNREVF